MDNDEQDTRERVSISSGHFSHDMQVADAMSYLETNHNDDYREIIEQFDWKATKWIGSWVDTEAMGVDQEWSSWLCDAIEDTGHVWWEDGEPWAYRDGES